jgi:diaminopimelate decarboxylase
MNKPIRTPYFLIREELLLQNIDCFRNALDLYWPNSIIAYSVKTNALPWILNWMNNHNIYAEVVSDEEYELALLSGYSAEHIVFNGPIKTSDYLQKAFAGGSIVNIDSQNEIDYLLKNKPIIEGAIGIRVNIEPSIFRENDIGFQEDGFRFGFCEENGDLFRVYEKIVKLYKDIPIGLHLHVNSITRSLHVYEALSAYAAKIIKKYGITLAYIDIGGGFFGGVPGKATPEEYIHTIAKEFSGVIDFAKTKLIIEPGSAAIGSAIELHSSVIDIKDTNHGRIVTTDGSRVHLDPLWKKSYYLYDTNSTKPNHPKQVICGYTCMDHDRIMVIENKPELSIGDHIIYYRVGNYTVTFGGPFIKPFPPVYKEYKNEIKVVRKEMTVNDYYKMESE